jgi:hypothetical protein
MDELEASRGDVGFEVLIALALNKDLYLLGCNSV